MAENLKLPTAVAAFCDFLDGKSVAPYGDRGTTVINILQGTIRVGLHQFSNQGDGMDEFDVLRYTVSNTFTLLRSKIHSALAPIDVDVALVVCHACDVWCDSFIREKSPGVLSNPQVLSGVKNLLPSYHKGEAPTQTDDARLIEISQELVLSMRQHLTDLRDAEEAAQGYRELSLSVRGMNLQEGLDGDLLPWGGWQDAWKQPFKGQALAALETKLQLNAHAIRTDLKKEQMSRIIPVVQASGTGKSRLAEEYGLFLAVLMTYRYVKKNFAVMLSFRNGSSFPRRVCL